MSFDLRTENTIRSLKDFAMVVANDRVFRAFGAPSPDVLTEALSEQPCLVALHLAATFYKTAVVSEVLQHYASRAKLAVEDFPVFSLLVNVPQGKQARSQAKSLYQYAVELGPNLAEAHYGIARLSQGGSSPDAALDGFRRVLSLSPHPNAPAHSFLHANARWELATILEDQERNKEALLSYRAAVVELGTFGVHHIRFARFLRRLGHFEEAAEHYRRSMIYSHRYFPEFVLPPLAKPEGSGTPQIDVIYSTRRGEGVIFWNGAYLAIDGKEWNESYSNPQQFEKYLAKRPSYRKAASIGALEDEVH
jgi:tetratricopeptide (TPR) repeat protein